MTAHDLRRVARKAAETMEGKCVRPKDLGDPSGWCSWHRSQWQAGHDVCIAMQSHVLLAEQAIEDADPIIRADLRARVEGLPGTGGGRLGSGFVAMPGDGDCIQRADVLALLQKALGEAMIEYPVGLCSDEWCKYQEPHRHGFACDRRCECSGIGPQTVPLRDSSVQSCDWGDCDRPAVAERIGRDGQQLPVCSWHAGWDDTP